MKPARKFIAALIVASPMLYSFCGFYVSKADGTIKNKTSQVILVRDGNRSVITMYNDFRGDTKDFAMVVPVPVVLKKSDIHVVDQAIFQRLNDYSAPRLVEYFDENPCEPHIVEDMMMSIAPMAKSALPDRDYKDEEQGVKVEAKYLVGEYDILILSATESTGLKAWLTANGYQLPAGAEEVLNPYIKSNLKFFVVKVNEEEKKKLPGNFLRPLQIAFNSPKFMLPIRLGMANADGDQDLLVYAFTRKGRIECTNYRNVEIASGNRIPLFVKQNFGSFYSNLFAHQWEKENKSIGFLEYAWDVSPTNYLKCDPCTGNPPTQQDIVQAGVWWLQRNWEDYSDVENNDNGEVDSKVFFSRMHFRYNRQNFPQDLVFQVTPNEESFQARYVITHPATGRLTCPEGRQYLKELNTRRKDELKELTALTGKNMDNWQQDMVSSPEEEKVNGADYVQLSPEVKKEGQERPLPAAMITVVVVLLGGAGLLRWKGLV